MTQNTNTTTKLLAEGHGAQVLKDTVLAALVVSLSVNLSMAVAFAYAAI